MVHEAIEDGIAKGGVAYQLMPVLGGELTRKERGSPPGAVFDDFE